MKKRLGLLAILILLLVFGPVLYVQINPPQKRNYASIGLATSDYREIFFRNEAQGINLAGMLFVPDGEGPFPAVVVIHGSGTSDRENSWYLALTKYLQQSGVVVLLPDKRGAGKSGGDWRTSSMQDLATDTLAALQFLHNQSEVEIYRTGIIGMSQGGWIAPIVASQSTDIDFLIDVSGTPLSADEQLVYEERNNLEQIGFLPGVSHALTYPSLFVLKHITQKGFWASVGNFDPLPYWRKVNLPALVIYGSDDTNVPAGESEARFKSLNKDRIEVITYPGSGHAIQDPPDLGDNIFRQEALTRIRQFIDDCCELGVIPVPGAARDDQLLRRPYTSQLDHNKREYLVYLPTGYDTEPQKEWPMMLFLHGNGERGDGLSELDFVMAHGPLFEAWIQRKPLPFIIVAPQLHMFDLRENGPDYIRNRQMKSLPARMPDGIPDREPFFETNRPMSGALPADMSTMPVTFDSDWSQVEPDLLAILDEVEAGFRVDKKRVYLTGLSLGGMGTWYLASRHPKRFAAIVPVVGFGHPSLMEPIAAHHIPVWAFAGGRDETVEARYFYPGINRLEELGHTEVRFTVHEDMGHDTWRRVYRGDDLYTWLLSHQLED